VVQNVARAAPGTKQLLLLPFLGTHRADIAAVVAGMQSGDVVFGDTSGFYPTVDSQLDGLHPFGYCHVGRIAPRIAALCLPLLG
jgi:hypothetical protein